MKNKKKIRKDYPGKDKDEFDAFFGGSLDKITDKMRLDWMQKKRASFAFILHGVWVRYGCGYDPDFCSSNLRKSIDASMRTKESKK